MIHILNKKAIILNYFKTNNCNNMKNDSQVEKTLRYKTVCRLLLIFYFNQFTFYFHFKGKF